MSSKEVITTNIRINNSIKFLKKHFPNCFDKNGSFNIEKFKQELQLNDFNFSKESYGLEWLGKSYARVLTFEPARTLLKDDEEQNNKPENINSQNILIKGDNLEVLKHLVHAYYEKIKMIYIDPPYNTGNDGFVYQDNRKFNVQELSELAGISEERAKRILDFVNSKSNSHSAWLTFMYPRLYIARRLLREDGAIFISIDDNEVAQLKLLMDEIFGEENFVGQLIVRKRAGGGSDSKFISIEHDYIIVYANDVNNDYSIKRLPPDISNYKNKDENGYYTIKPLNNKGLSDSKGLHYDIQCPDDTILEGNKHQWVYSQETFDKMNRENRIIFKKDKNGGWKIYYKLYFHESRGKVPFSIIYNNALNKYATQELNAYNFNKDIIKKIRPKPIFLIKHLLRIGSTRDSIILDFFAGSGTTGDAVMQLNAEDGGNRKFILVQLPEPIDKKKNKTAYDFVQNELGVETPTIFDICKERLVRAAKKIQTEVIPKRIAEKQKELQKLKSQLDINGDQKEKIKKLEREIKALQNQDLGFKIFETVPLWEDYLADEKELTEQTTLFEVSKLSDEDLKALLITWKTYDGIPLTEECEKITINDYPAYYCGNNLYLLHKGWKTENIKSLLKKIDNEKDFVVDKIIVFGYNFSSKHLRELEENIRNYANKKQMDIEVILRF